MPEALIEAQQAVALAPDSVRPNELLGDIFAAMGRTDEARMSYQKALVLAQTIEPDFQIGLADGLQKKLATTHQ